MDSTKRTRFLSVLHKALDIRVMKQYLLEVIPKKKKKKMKDSKHKVEIIQRVS